MSRSERLFDLLDLLRAHRRPVRGQVLADGLGVSLRTLYRDIASLQSLGAHIEGEPGVGYVLKPGFLLPPLMFSPEEIEALVLGSRWVADRADPRLSEAAKSALVRIAAVLPSDLRDDLETSGLVVGPGAAAPVDVVDQADLRAAIRAERKLRIVYSKETGERTERIVWPFALAFFDRVRLLTTWCELRNDFRSFRTDRIASADPLGERYPRRRAVLLKEWRDRRAAE
ncbi:helix-turn-helix transcriptional regulator [Amorphus orientalis]|uniref:DNA-binding transcriptional regulator YafY n=1 Tax=Amorphus orientalis TaxID=649198 RepID=A0AAE4ATM9_9HYPH|nr:YafY family protein [Amorphus orientalis]MDQ0317456.1 putative DNA-binding transcriptional regulator YafY [Amorphus orientalis]